MEVSSDYLKKRKQVLTGLENDRLPFWNLWRELANYYLPKRYVWLQTAPEARIRSAKNPYILDGTGTKAARILAAGMMNGITSPSRPWFSLRIPGFTDNPNTAARLWCDEVTRRMLTVMAETNLYNALATMYLDLVVFGTSAMLIYEDDESVFRCYNPALGEYYLGQDFRLQVNTFARCINLKVNQVVAMFGEENCSQTVRDAYKRGGASGMDDVKIAHLIEPNIDGKSKVPKRFAFRECYWEKHSTEEGKILSERGFNELPGVFPRYELSANDSYGTCPAMDALPDVIQLQLETKRKAQGLDKMMSPPMLADIQLRHQPTALVPNGVTFVAGNTSFGMKPAYQVQMPLGEITADIADVRTRIEETFHNPLFNMISQLNTVRSATEIDARREEKLVLLGSVLERFENEALDPAISRIFAIMMRAGMLPEPPEEIGDQAIEVQYVSILSTAQRAVSAIPTERWIGLIGNIAAISPEALMIPKWENLIRHYGEAIGVETRDMNSEEEVAVAKQAQQQQLQAQQAAVEGEQLVAGAKSLSETDVGGGSNALQMLLGG